MGHVRLGFVVGVGLFAAVLAGPAHGQTAGLNELWSIPGVIVDNYTPVIGCTNRNTSNETIAVDVYDAAGTYVATGPNSITVAPNATVLFALNEGFSTIVNLSIDQYVNVGGIISKGHARVLSSAKSRVQCSAFLANWNSGEPYADLTIAKKTKQKGD